MYTFFNADRIFFGTDKGMIKGSGDINAVCAKKDLLAFADEILGSAEKDENSEIEEDGTMEAIIPVGQHENAMFFEATRVLTRHGDTEEARAMFDRFMEQ